MIQFALSETAEFGDDQLRGEISTKESHWYSFLSADDRYDQDRLAYDQELLRKFYLSQGYADFRVVSAVAELSQSRDAFFITFTVEEGKRYKVGKIDIRSSLRGLDPALLKPDVSFRSGDWYDGEVQKTVDDMTKTLGDLQYAFAVVRPGVEPESSQEALNIAFEVANRPRFMWNASISTVTPARWIRSFVGKSRSTKAIHSRGRSWPSPSRISATSTISKP